MFKCCRVIWFLIILVVSGYAAWRYIPCNCEKVQRLSAMGAAAPVGPYVHTVVLPKNSNQVLTSGCIGIIDGELVESLEGQVHATFKNMKAALKAADCSLKDVVKISIFLKDLSDYSVVNRIYSEYFNEGNFPVRSCVEVAALPKGALIEIEAVAVKS